jgi:DDE superfamily endonuclease
MIASKMCSSTNDNTAYIVTQLSKDIKSGLLPDKYHVVLDEAYPCTEQEMSPWKGRNLSEEKDAFNYYMSLNRQVIERAFGILIQRWGIFWRPLKISMEHRGVAIRVACKLHNICIDDFGFQRIIPIRSHSVPGFERETDHQNEDEVNIQFTDGTPLQKRGYRSDLEKSTHRDKWTKYIKNNNLSRPRFSKYSKKIIRK